MNLSTIITIWPWMDSVIMIFSLVQLCDCWLWRCRSPTINSLSVYHQSVAYNEEKLRRNMTRGIFIYRFRDTGILKVGSGEVRMWHSIRCIFLLVCVPFASNWLYRMLSWIYQKSIGILTVFVKRVFVAYTSVVTSSSVGALHVFKCHSISDMVKYGGVLE